ncbi:hydroxysteroid 11-beta-dehydrogenase 1-like protein B [Terrapene carolina triunguis]|uniref:Hydroxysteroid 11-beta-dehydrogenase 1-like protein B n=1 Tax=Terrapene triunguis TaxID=2587831 RepID=A0A674JGP0_9SAUR|nr:hydroxysteroid 11-beta-dehydrogenase 1-like protein B [Terrapene carolina triunguis]
MIHPSVYHRADTMAAIRLLLSLLVGLCAYYFYSQETLSAEMVRGKRVLVTGSSTGIGEQIAYEFARMGAHLLLTARREKQLKEVAQKCLELGASSARHVVSDMNNLTSAQNVIEEARNKLGGLDYLVLNHVGGSGRFGPFQGDMAAVTSSMTVNFLSYVQLTVSAMTMLQESRGSIIVISSLSGRIGAPFTLSYNAAKFALEGFYSSLRRELCLREISLSVTVAVLGYIDTDNALKSIGDKITMQANPKEECAREVVRAGVLRHREVIYPYWVLKPLLLLKEWMPGLMERLLDKFFVLENIL